MEPRSGSEVTERVAPFAAAVAVERPTLDELAIGISRLFQPDLDPLSVMAELDTLAASCPTPTRDGVMLHLFGSGRLVGDRTAYHRWQGSCLDHALHTGRGMPITLAVVGIEVARRLGVHLGGVGMPGHFLIGDPADPDWFGDPFHALTGLGRDECRALMVSRGMTRWSDRFLQTIPPRLIAARMLNNVKVACERQHDEVRLALVMRARQELPELGDEPADARSALAVFN